MDWLGESDSENEAYHALFFRILRVGERHGATTEAEAYVAVFVGMPGYECRGGGRPSGGFGAEVVVGVGGKLDFGAVEPYGVDGAVQPPAFLGRAVFLGGALLVGGELVLEGVALAHTPKEVRHISGGGKCLCAEKVQRAVDDLTGYLRGFIEVVGGADAEQGVYGLYLFLDVGHVAPRCVEVDDLLGAHRSGPLGGGLLYLYGRQRGLRPGV